MSKPTNIGAVAKTKISVNKILGGLLVVHTIMYVTNGSYRILQDEFWDAAGKKVANLFKRH